jgi:HSP20 family molecular chaperone IbpA
MVYTDALLPTSPSLSRRHHGHSSRVSVVDEFTRNTPEHLLNVHAVVEENDAMFRMVAEIPGIKPENVNVEVNGKYLIISGEIIREDEEDEDFVQLRKRGLLLSSTSVDRFVRKFILPRNVDLSSIDAGVSKSGKLVVTVLKTYYSEDDEL